MKIKNKLIYTIELTKSVFTCRIKVNCTKLFINATLIQPSPSLLSRLKVEQNVHLGLSSGVGVHMGQCGARKLEYQPLHSPHHQQTVRDRERENKLIKQEE